MIGTFFGIFFSNFGTFIKTISSDPGNTLPVGRSDGRPGENKKVHTYGISRARQGCNYVLRIRRYALLQCRSYVLSLRYRALGVRSLVICDGPKLSAATRT